jgi:hypothetical protein
MTSIPFLSDLGSENLAWIVVIQSLLLIPILGLVLYRLLQNIGSNPFIKYFSKVKIDVILEKDRVLRPQLLTMTIRNTGKEVADLDAPVLIFRKIWSVRKFKLNGLHGQQLYPLFLDPGMRHRMPIELANFYQYDKSVKKYYWARIAVSDVKGKKWKSNEVKLRKSLVT